VRVAVLTVSDGVVAGTREDTSGRTLVELLSADGHDVVETAVTPDEEDEIEAALRRLAGAAELVLTTGGTGFAPRDVTPEATRRVIEREAPGLSEAVRAAALAKTPHAMLSRAVAGIAGRTVIVNFPGSPGGCRDGWSVLREALPHAVKLLRDEQTPHRQT